MGSEQWTSRDVERWRRLRPSGWATALVVAVWLAGQVAFYFEGPPVPSDSAFLCYVTLALTSVLLIRLYEAVAIVLAVILAVVEASWFQEGIEPELLLVVALTSFPAVCALHAWYLRYARTRQRRYAASRALMHVSLPTAHSVRTFSAKEEFFSAVKAWFAFMCILFLPLALVVVKDSDAPWEVVGTSIWIALAFLVAIVAGTARDARITIRSQLHLISGRHVGIPAEAAIGDSGQTVHVYVKDRSKRFAKFVAWRPPDEPPPAPGDRITGVLYGDLCKDGWAAFAADRVLILPNGPLDASWASDSSPPEQSNGPES